MSFTAVVALVLAINLVCALMCGFIAGRTGRDPFSWVLAGGILGPFALIALAAVGGKRSPSVSAPATAVVGGVLIPVDGSEPSLAAVQHVIDSPARNGPVTLVAVLPLERGDGALAEPFTPMRREYDEDVELHLGEARRRLQSAGISYEEVVRFGSAAEEILRLAETGGYSQIVMGRRGRGLAQLLLGSVSDNVVKNARIPVMLAG